MLLFVFLGKRETITFIKHVLFHILGIVLGKHNLSTAIMQAYHSTISWFCGYHSVYKCWYQHANFGLCLILRTFNVQYVCTFYYIKVKGKVSIPQGLNQIFSWFCLVSVDFPWRKQDLRKHSDSTSASHRMKQFGRAHKASNKE